MPPSYKKDSANIAKVSESEGEDTENVQITLITEKSEVNNVFVAEMSCSAVIDCSKTVAGIDWFTNYSKKLWFIKPSFAQKIKYSFKIWWR